MTPYAMGLVVALAAAAAVLIVMSVVAASIWHTYRESLPRLAPRPRARLLAALRLLPSSCGIAAGVAVFSAFVRLEPANAGEQLGVLLPTLAVAALVLFGWRILTAALAWHRTARAVVAWKAQPLAIDCDFPIVAVVGIWRPQLYISRRVVEVCDREELDAMCAHEEAHVAAGDNFTRLLLLATPFTLTASARELEAAWTRAAEDAADDAARRNPRAALALASALIKVARLAARQPMPLLHVSAIFSGSSVNDRVRRLLETPTPQLSRDTSWRYVWVAAAGCVVVTCAAAIRPIYDAAEFCVRYLP